MDIYKKKITVTEDHIDGLNHVNNVIYLQWVQDIAVEHWNSKTSESLNAEYMWMVVDHFIKYRKQAFQEDELTVETYVSSNRAATSERHVKFYRDSELLVEAKTTWCLLDRESGRPKRVTEEIQSLFQ